MNELSTIERTKMFWAAPDDSWHTKDTICAVTGLADQTLANWRSRGYGPKFVKSGSLVYYTKRHIIEWFKQFQPSQTQV